MTQDIKLYYTAPNDEVFENCRDCAIKIWKTYKDSPSASEKIDRIKNVKNIRDNFMYIVAMFDVFNQKKLLDMVTDETRKSIQDRLPKDYMNYGERG